jgi:transposase-like protein
VIRLNDRQIARLVERYEAGVTTYELATEFGVHRTTLSQHIKTARVKMRLQPLTPQQVDGAVVFYATGLPLADVGREVGRHASTYSSPTRRRE